MLGAVERKLERTACLAARVAAAMAATAGRPRPGGEGQDDEEGGETGSGRNGSEGVGDQGADCGLLHLAPSPLPAAGSAAHSMIPVIPRLPKRRRWPAVEEGAPGSVPEAPAVPEDAHGAEEAPALAQRAALPRPVLAPISENVLSDGGNAGDLPRKALKPLLSTRQRAVFRPPRKLDT